MESRFQRAHKFSEGAAEAPLSTREIESPRRNHVREKICIKEERTAAVPLKMSEIYLVGEPSCSDIKHDLARTSGSCYSTLYRNPFPLTPRLYQGATVTPSHIFRPFITQLAETLRCIVFPEDRTVIRENVSSGELRRRPVLVANV